MSEKLRFDPYLNQINTELLPPMAKVWAGKGVQRKQDCIKAITDGLKNPQTVQDVIQQLKPFERLALELAKVAHGEMKAEDLLQMLRLLDAEELPEFHKESEPDHKAFAKYLVKRGIFLCIIPISSYNYAESDRSLSVFTDERLLTHIGSPSFNKLPLKNHPEPKLTTVRRPANVVLNILGMLQAIEQQDGFKLTQKGTFQLNSLKKFTKSQNWKDESTEVDGFLFHDPANAFAFALLNSDLLIPTKENTINLRVSIEEFAKYSQKEQVELLIHGFVKSIQWLEFRENRWYNRELFIQGREILLSALKLLPEAGRHWVDFDEFEQILFKRLGEFFSLKTKPSYPRRFVNDTRDELTILKEWRDKLRQDWLGYERVWLKYALSSWLYYLGIVELGLLPSLSAKIQNDSISSFRLTDLGRLLLYPQETDNNLVTEYSSQQAWIVQPNFEVMVYLEDVNPLQLALLERHAERVSVQQHIAQYRLTRDSVYNGWENGYSLTELLAALQEGSKVGLPQNVETELQQWGNLYEQVKLRKRVKLLEFADEASRESAVNQGLKGKPIGDKFLLVGERASAKSWFGDIIDYNQPLPRCLSITEDGMVTITQSTPDLLIHEQLNRWMEVQADGSWRLSRKSVTDAVKAGAKPEELIEFLRSRLTTQIPNLLNVAIQGWVGIGTTVEVEKVLVLRCTNPAVFNAIASSPKLAPYLLGKLAPDVLLVDEKQSKKFASELEWAGLKVLETLQNVPKVE
ncbi:helicase-associated domain-containing protein [Iningainema tapete]|uniref:Helicase-associated domain-containing protein n=1 Tax=Iningainema tapete BLCC-T55 TaxID=2748662 RepID=A0A8J6XN26_9CYAN|nr:helicase-associated domain-containing protein [Iningainema tapete]MBD2774051.1 helicase-associated domain-containing protein [Iningainema tapete BLCC-T55]